MLLMLPEDVVDAVVLLEDSMEAVTLPEVKDVLVEVPAGAVVAMVDSATASRNGARHSASTDKRLLPRWMLSGR